MGIGLRQRCVLSPLLSIVYINWIGKCNQADNCVTIQNCKTSRVLFADDLVLLSLTESGLQRALNSFAGACRCVARIWKRGGLFWKSEKCANDLDWNFHWSRSSFRRFVRKLRRNFSDSLEIQSFFPPKIRWSPKKKKKKRSSPISTLIFRPISQIQTFEGGLFSIFLRKSASKAQKTCDFAYFTSQWEGSSPPAPPLATLLGACNTAEMKISTAKTEVLIPLSRNPDQCVLQVNGMTLKQEEKFK